MPAVDEILDGYRLIRLIGSGGFGDVWLCQMQSTGEYRALKFVPQDQIRHLDRELQALRAFRREVEHGAANHLVSIEHINRCEAGLFYVMPLADGPSGVEILDAAWKPLTLEAVIGNRRSAPRWFTVEEIVRIFRPLALAAQALSDAGLVHRDIKPQNILFFGGLPRLADIGLVSVDDAELSEMGTPGYVAPQWYLAAHGNPDMWGLAATLYHCATGNHPDYMSRPAYRWPPSGKEGMTAMERQRWLAMLGVAYRATQENPSERYIQFRDMANALDTLSPVYPDVLSRRPQTYFRKRPSRVFIALLVALAAFALGGVLWHEIRMVEIAQFPTVTSESGAWSVKSSPVAPTPSAFENELKTAKGDFESLIQGDRKFFLYDHPPTDGNVAAFRKLLQMLANKHRAPMAEIREILTQMKALAPGVDMELGRNRDSTLNKSIEELQGVANRPRQLATNAEEERKAREFADDLLGKLTGLKDDAVTRKYSNLDDALSLVNRMHNETTNWVDARKIRKGTNDDSSLVQAECDEIQRLSDEVDKALTPVTGLK